MALFITFCVLVVIVVIYGSGLFAPVLAPYSYTEQNLDRALEGSSADYWLGTDRLRRDLKRGAKLGKLLGKLLGNSLGTELGALLGRNEGGALGTSVGIPLGNRLGVGVG